MPESVHPLSVGTRVRHVGHQWPDAQRLGTGHVVEAKGPMADDAYEYVVLLDRPWGILGLIREWASYATVPVERAMSAQRYTSPQSQEWMAEGRCPECGEPATAHLDDPRFWLPRRCDLLPRGVLERIEYALRIREEV